MRKDVKRSLLLWPAAASITITAVSWLPTQLPSIPDRVSPPRFLASLVPRPRVELLKSSSSAVTQRIEMTARLEHGTRAMPLPDRVAAAFGVAKPALKAPVRHERQELAGLALGSPHAVEPSVRQRDDSSMHGDPMAASQGIAASTQLPGRSMMVSEQRLPRLGAPRAEMELVEPSLPEFWEPEITMLSAPEVKPASVLPKSNRALGRRRLTSPALEGPRRGMPIHDALAEVGDSLGAGLLTQGPQSDASLTPESSRVFPIIIDGGDPVVTSEKSSEQLRPPFLASPAGWPMTIKLNEQLKTLSMMAINSRPDVRNQLVSMSSASSRSYQRIPDWTDDVASRLEQLRSLPRLGDDRAGTLIRELSELAAEGQRCAELLEDRAQQIQWLGTCFAISRRAAIWRLVWQVTRGENAWMVGDRPKDAMVSISEATANVRVDLEETGDIDGWNRYLLLEELSRARLDYSSDERTLLAQRFLARLQWHRLGPEQRRWLQRTSIRVLSELVRRWAQDAIDYANLMHQIELQEADSLDLASVDVAGAVQTLRFADNPLANQISKAIDTYYRNANLRLALSAEMLQRALPEVESKSFPVDTRILGSRVRGNSRVESDLTISLIPSPDRWTLRLNTVGDAVTNSTGVRSSVAVRTTARSQFEAETPIEITPIGVRLNESQVGVNGSTRLRSIGSDYDGWPLIGSLVRSIAENRYQALAPQANRIANRTIRGRIQAEIDEQMEQQVDAATDQLSQLLLGPLGRLQLDPKVTDMQTTQQRLLARFRVAGDWQMAASTPRPRAPRTSLMSVQVHQSAINNTLDQIIPKGEQMSIREFVTRATEAFGRSDVAIPNDVPEDVLIQFARTRPVTVEMEEGRMWITLRIVRLSRKSSVNLTQFIVRAAYRPQTDGMRASLVRDGHLRISGPRMSMRERIPARTIFNKVFSSNREIPVTLPKLLEHPAVEGLSVSQLELRSGWIAIAVSESDAPHIALAP